MPEPSQSGIATEVHVVRMGMGVAAAERLADVLLRCPPDVAARVQDQLWLRTIFSEQMRRMRINERGLFAVRADRILELLDAPEVPDA